MKSRLISLIAPAILAATPVFADIYPDPLLTMPVVAENIVKAKEIEAYTLGVSAYLWGCH